MLTRSWRNREAHRRLVTLGGGYDSPHIWEHHTHYKLLFLINRVRMNRNGLIEIILNPSGFVVTIQMNHKLFSGLLQTTGIAHFGKASVVAFTLLRSLRLCQRPPPNVSVKCSMICYQCEKSVNYLKKLEHFREMKKAGGSTERPCK